MHWRVKAVVQKTVGVMPYGDRIHLQLQRKAGGLSNFRRECESKIDDWKIMAGHFHTIGQGFADTTFMEIGTGWYPTFPFCTYLSGAKRIFTLDLNRHLQSDLTMQCALRIGDHLQTIAEISGRSLDAVTRDHTHLLDQMATGADLSDATRGVICYDAPADARNTSLKEDSIDVVFSNSVLEHVPEADIAAMMKESRRVLCPGGIVFHSVNCGDHYSYVDSSVTQLNYLRYSDTQWKKWNSPFLYQNRLRAVDLVRLAESAGFDIVLNTAKPTPKRRAELEKIPVADCFRRYSADDLCITTVDFIGRKS